MNFTTQIPQGQGFDPSRVRKDYVSDRMMINEQACYDQALFRIGQGDADAYEIHWHKDEPLACPSIVRDRQPYPQCYWITKEETNK
jgi:hypothetical protein